MKFTMDSSQFGPPGYKGSAFVPPIDRSKWGKYPVISNIVTGADKKRGTTVLKEILEAENLTPSEIHHILAHERKHLKKITSPAEIGVYRDESGKLMSCYIHRLDQETTPEEIMEITSAGGALFTEEGEGDTALWLHSLRRTVERG